MKLKDLNPTRGLGFRIFNKLCNREIYRKETIMYEKLKKQIEENPMLAIGIGAAAVTAVAKLVDAVTAAQGRHAYAKQINYKVKNKK